MMGACWGRSAEAERSQQAGGRVLLIPSHWITPGTSPALWLSEVGPCSLGLPRPCL